MGAPHYIYLVPGFFGFANLGDFRYFGHLHELLASQLTAAGVDPHIELVRTHPTASIRKRARRLLETIQETAGTSDAPIHLIGHSTGGLDARLLVGSHCSLGEGADPEPIVRRVRTVVTVASPHRGAPLAAFFASMLGQRLLQLLTLATVYGLRFGHVPLSFLLKLAAVLVRRDGAMGWRAGLLDQLFEQLLAEFTAERRKEVEAFLAQVSDDQALLMQLTPDAMDVFNAGVTNQPGVRYGAVITRAPAPTARARLRIGLDPYAQATYGIYELIHARTSLMPKRSVELPSGEALTVVQRGLGSLPTEADNDGIVPTLSQLWGDVIAAVDADHLDIIGHFDCAKHEPPHVDWLCSGASFSRQDLERTWHRVVQYILRPG